MCAQAGSRDTFDRLASEYDELKLRVIPGYRQVQGSRTSIRERAPQLARSRTRMRHRRMGIGFLTESSRG
jgi:hypothetical protein